MSSTKNLAPYISIIVAGIIGFQSFAIGQVAPEPRKKNASEAPKDPELPPSKKAELGKSAQVVGRKVLDLEKFAEYAELASGAMDDPNLLAQATRVRDTLKSMADGLDQVSRDPYHNPKFSDFENRMLNHFAVGQLILNQGSQILAAMAFTGPKVDAFLLALPMLSGTILKNWTDANAMVSPEAIHQQIQQAMNQAGLDQSVKEEIDAEIVKVRLATEKLLEARSVWNEYFLKYGYNLSSSSWYSLSNLIAYGAFMHAFLELFAGKWKAAAAMANGLEEAGRIIGHGSKIVKEAGVAAKQAEAVAGEVKMAEQGLGPILKNAIGLLTIKMGQRGGKTAGTATIGTANGLDASAYAYASSSAESLESVQALTSAIRNSILLINGQIRMMSEKK